MHLCPGPDPGYFTTIAEFRDFQLGVTWRDIAFEIRRHENIWLPNLIACCMTYHDGEIWLKLFLTLQPWLGKSLKFTLPDVRK